ncbi:MAG: putative toxin-antitoxin system toxin component, PIN family [Endomicrobium sp.]|jgi:putative PIN family toxin of toxin-antitoxin system|nr:putative toxin-antitoxin system toxin component, PIN family [Endomicrobium sp.]
MRVVFDTNIFISAFYFGGNPKIVLDMVTAGIDELFISKEITDEILSVMTRPKFNTDIKYVEYFIKSIEEISESVMTNGTIAGSRDSDDNKILECALFAKADYIITGDDDLLSLKSFKNVSIVSPNEYIEKISKRGL